MISDSFFFTEIDFTRPIAAARSPLSRIGVTGDRISLLSNRGVTVGNPASVKLADITFVCDSAGNASFDVSVPFKADTVSATVGARGETTTFGGNQVVAARRGTFEGSVTFSMAPVNCVSAVATPTSTPEPTATPSVTTNPTSTPTVVEESSEETSVGGGSPTVEPTVTPTAAPTATPDNSSSNSGNSGDSASGCFGLKEGGYTSSDDGCELGSGLSLNTTSEGNIVLSPFGSNGNTTFISAGSNARSFRNDLTLFEIGGHSCRLSCTPPNKFIVSCSNPFGGSCSQTFTAQ